MILNDKKTFGQCRPQQILLGWDDEFVAELSERVLLVEGCGVLALVRPDVVVVWERGAVFDALDVESGAHRLRLRLFLLQLKFLERDMLQKTSTC
jgi:hypothetical protein